MKEFGQLYAANFRQLTESDGLKYWAEFVEKMHDGTLREAVESLATEYASKKSVDRMTAPPRLADVKNAYFRLRQRKRQEEIARYAGAGSVCAYCDNLGLVIICVDSKGNLCNPEESPKYRSGIGVYNAPCACRMGNEQAAKRGYDLKTRQMFVRNRFAASGIETAERRARVYAECNE